MLGHMKPISGLLALIAATLLIEAARCAEKNVLPTQEEVENPAEHLPRWITRLTRFGERADWSHDGKKILFLEKTYGDVFEVDVAGRIIRPVTHHYHHLGYTRALYLANGDILLSGPEAFDPKNPHVSREQCFLYVLDKSLTKPPVAFTVQRRPGGVAPADAHRVDARQRAVSRGVAGRRVADAGGRHRL